MPAKKKSGKNRPGGRSGQLPAAVVDAHGQPIAPWQWRTFPVYFALSAGLFVGLILGLATGIVRAIGYAAGIVIAFMFSQGLAFLFQRRRAERIARRRMRA